MQAGTSTRRGFLRQSLVTGTAGWAATRMTAASYARVLGANDRINIGVFGLGVRGNYNLQHMLKPNPNVAVTAVCDIWKQRREAGPAAVEKLYGGKPKAHADYREVLDSADVDAVIVSTPDHQHAAQAIDAIRAGKHAYVEKPVIGLAEDLDELNKLYDVVKSSKMVVQHGTQGVSGPAAEALKKFIAEGSLGKLFRIEATETAYVPYWKNYPRPESESDVDWKAFLHNRKPRPYDAHMYGCWMGYWEITSGTIGGWMTHFINTVHYVTGSEAPVAATAWGGRYAPTDDPRCTAPDNTVVVLDYAEGFHTQFTSHFGSEINNEQIIFMFEKGSVKCQFGHWLKNPIVSGEGTPNKIEPHGLLEQDEPYTGAGHVGNWLDCIRNGGRPNSDMESGYKQGISVVMGDLACKTGRKVVFDKAKREVRPA